MRTEKLEIEKGYAKETLGFVILYLQKLEKLTPREKTVMMTTLEYMISPVITVDKKFKMFDSKTLNNRLKEV